MPHEKPRHKPGLPPPIPDPTRTTHAEAWNEQVTLNIKNRIMKKHLLTLSAITLAAHAWSQVQVGAKGGLNLAHVSTNQTMIDNHKKTWATLQGGLVLDFSASDNFSFQPHILLQGKGTRWETDSIKAKYRINNIRKMASGSMMDMHLLIRKLFMLEVPAFTYKA
jgi:hypothetical protein